LGYEEKSFGSVDHPMLMVVAGFGQNEVNAAAPKYPTKAINLIVPWSPGGVPTLPLAPLPASLQISGAIPDCGSKTGRCGRNRPR